MRLVLVDSSAFLSLEDRDERDHLASRDALEVELEAGALLITTNFIFDETYTLIMSRLGRERAIAWGDSFRRGSLVRLIRVDEDHEDRAWEILTDFPDKSFSYTDATSFAVAESLGVACALSLDRHFRQFGGFQVVPR